MARPMFAPMVPATSVLFVSQASIEHGVVQTYGLRKRIEPVRGCRTIGKKDMRFNDAMPRMRVDPERYNRRGRRRGLHRRARRHPAADAGVFRLLAAAAAAAACCCC